MTIPSVRAGLDEHALQPRAGGDGRDLPGVVGLHDMLDVGPGSDKGAARTEVRAAVGP